MEYREVPHQTDSRQSHPAGRTVVYRPPYAKAKGAETHARTEIPVHTTRLGGRQRRGWGCCSVNRDIGEWSSKKEEKA